MKLMDLKRCLEGHNATIEPKGKPMVQLKGEHKKLKAARDNWAEATEQSWKKARKRK